MGLRCGALRRDLRASLSGHRSSASPAKESAGSGLDSADSSRFSPLTSLLGASISRASRIPFNHRTTLHRKPAHPVESLAREQPHRGPHTEQVGRQESHSSRRRRPSPACTMKKKKGAVDMIIRSRTKARSRPALDEKVRELIGAPEEVGRRSYRIIAGSSANTKNVRGGVDRPDLERATWSGDFYLAGSVDPRRRGRLRVGAQRGTSPVTVRRRSRWRRPWRSTGPFEQALEPPHPCVGFV